jgi:hypothetical protein
MRVTKNGNGQFVVEDEPMRLEGEAAAQLLREIDADKAVDSTRARFLAECEEAYQQTLIVKR